MRLNSLRLTNFRQHCDTFVTFDTGRHQWERSDVLGMGAEIAAVLSRRLGCVTTAYVVEFG